jgi:hypothetical protein
VGATPPVQDPSAFENLAQFMREGRIEGAAGFGNICRVGAWCCALLRFHPPPNSAMLLLDAQDWSVHIQHCAQHTSRLCRGFRAESTRGGEGERNGVVIPAFGLGQLGAETLWQRTSTWGRRNPVSRRWPQPASPIRLLRASSLPALNPVARRIFPRWV